MSAAQQPPARSGFWEERTGWSRLKQLLLLEPLPGGSRWLAAFGSLLLFIFVLQVVTGVLLALNYAPSVDSSWPSVKYIQEEVPLGAFMRAVHHWGSSAMVILLLVHLVQVFVWGAYKPPRELTWMVGVLLLCCTLGLAFTGYLLPWDQKAYWATKVGLGIASTTPGIGDELRILLQGGPQMGNLTLTRFFTMHAFILPMLLMVLAAVHLYLFRLHGVTPPWWESAERLKAEAEPFWPSQAWKDGLVALVFLVGLGLWCYYCPAPLEARADPAQPYEARPEWYFMFLFQLLKYFKGPYEVVGTFVLPALFFLVLFFWPFLDRSPQRDPRRRPLAMGLLTGGTVGLVGLTVFAIASDVRMREPVWTRVPAAAEPADVLQREDVAKLYHAHCTACHGIDGSGKQIRAGMPTVPDFTSLAWQMSQTDLEITHRIQDGNEPLMPAYRNKLAEKQIFALSIYVRAFSIVPIEPTAPKLLSPSVVVTAQMSPPRLYRAYCLACHDADGRGNSVRQAMPAVADFADPKWQDARTDADLTQSLLDGKGKFMLPMKDKLSRADAEQMVSYVRAFRGGKQLVELEPRKQPVPPPPEQPAVVPGPKTTDVPQPPSAASTAPAARIRVATGLYRQYCLICHGADGRGIEMKPSMPTIPDFSSRSWQETVTNSQLAAGTLDGKGVLMPAFRGRVSSEQAQDLVAYIRSFGPPQVGKKEEPASDFEKRFRQLQEQWEELDKQLKEASQPERKP